MPSTPNHESTGVILSQPARPNLEGGAQSHVVPPPNRAPQGARRPSRIAPSAPLNLSGPLSDLVSVELIDAFVAPSGPPAMIPASDDGLLQHRNAPNLHSVRSAADVTGGEDAPLGISLRKRDVSSLYPPPSIPARGITVQHGRRAGDDIAPSLNHIWLFISSRIHEALAVWPLFSQHAH
jgi:hypothetical protein